MTSPAIHDETVSTALKVAHYRTPEDPSEGPPQSRGDRTDSKHIGVPRRGRMGSCSG